jgi:hypothetical protein
MVNNSHFLVIESPSQGSEPYIIPHELMPNSFYLLITIMSDLFQYYGIKLNFIPIHSGYTYIQTRPNCSYHIHIRIAIASRHPTLEAGISGFIVHKTNRSSSHVVSDIFPHATNTHAH